MANSNLGTILSVVSAICAGISALGSLAAVYVANQQVKVALDTVSNGERVKYISDFANSSYKVCRAITPEVLRNEIFRSISSDKSTYGKIGWRTIQGIDAVNSRVGEKISHRNEELAAALDELFVKTQAVSVWLPPGKFRDDLNLNTATLHLRLPDGSYSQDISASALIGKRNYCEIAVGTIVEEMLKQGN